MQKRKVNTTGQSACSKVIVRAIGVRSLLRLAYSRDIFLSSLH